MARIKRKKQNNYRLRDEVLEVLNAAVKRSGLTKTQVIELCILKYAMEIPGLKALAVQQAGKVLFGDLGEGEKK